LHALRLGFKLLTYVLELLLQRHNRVGFRIHVRGELFQRRRRFLLFALPRLAFLAQRFSKRRLLGNRGFNNPGELFIRRNAVAPSFVPLGVKRRIQQSHFFLQRDERFGGGIRGAVVLRFFHGSRLPIRRDEGFQARNLLLPSGNFFACLRGRGGGGGFRPLCVTLFLQKLLLDFVPEFVRVRERRRVLRRVVLQLLGVRIH